MRKLIGFSVKAVVSAVLLYFAVAEVNLSAIGERLRDLNFGWVAGAVALAFVQLGLLSIRWVKVAHACQAKLGSMQAFRWVLIAAFFNQVLPSTIGGDAMRVWLFARQGASWSQATYSVLLDRFVGVVALSILVIGCMPWTFELIQNPIGRTAVLIIGLSSLGGAAAFVAIGFLPWNWLRHWQPTRHLTQMSVTVRTLLFSAGGGGLVLGLSLAIHVLTAGVAWCLAHAIDAPFSFLQALALIPPVMLLATIPISIAGWGIREKSLVLAFIYAGLPASDGLLISVLLGATTFAIGVVGGVVWLAGSNRVKAGGVARASEG